MRRGTSSNAGGPRPSSGPGRLDPDLLHERVDGEWSFIETLRHLVFATDAWVRRALLGDPGPWSPLDLPHDDMADSPSVPRDRGAPVTRRGARAAGATGWPPCATSSTGSPNSGSTGDDPVTEPGYPEPRDFPVADILAPIVNEEWCHHHYATRDLAILEQRAHLRSTPT